MDLSTGKNTRRAVGLLAVVAVVTAGNGLAPGEAFGADRTGATGRAGAMDRARAVRQLDAMGGSGSAGIDPARADAITAAQADAMAGDVSFSVPSGTFQGQVSVQLTTAIANAQIRYTTDGTPPTATSTLYQGTPLVFTKTTQLRARAVVSGATTGAMGTALYVARAMDASHDLPLVVMDAYGGGKPARDYRDVSVMVMDTQGGPASLAKAPTVATRAGFHLRGQSSANFEKAPYRLELWDNENSDADYPMLGMPADSDWVLRGPFPDKTLMRDAFAYGLGRDMGLQAPRFAFVELYLNLDSAPMAADDYQGVYLLVETIKQSPDRLNIQKLKDTDLTAPAVTGGYLLQINWMAAEPPVLQCTRKRGQSCWSDLEVVEPKTLLPEQQAWITEYVQKFHDSLHGANPSDPQTGYPAYIDVNSFINRIIHNELAREGDAYIRSTHFYKDRGGKLVAGPLWDYDLGYAAFTGFGGTPSPPGIEGWQFQPFVANTNDWFLKLMRDPAFSSRVNARWQALRQGVMADAELNARVAALAAVLANAATRNFQRWPILGIRTVGGFGTQVTATWEEQLQVLRTFLSQRAAWLDTSGWNPTTA